MPSDNHGGLLGMLMPLVLVIAFIYIAVRLLAYIFGGPSRRKSAERIAVLEYRLEQLSADLDKFKNELNARSSPLGSVKSETAKSTGSITFPDTHKGAAAAYKYDDVTFALLPTVFPSAVLGKAVTFRVFDKGVSVHCYGAELGTLTRGKLSNMLSNWLERSDPYLAYITHADDDQRYCSFDIVFYRDSDESEVTINL